MEKSIRKVAVLLLVIGFSTLLGQGVKAQCSGGTLAGTITPTLSWQTLPCVRGGEYYSFTATAGVYYTFTFCTGGGSAIWNTQITMLNNAGAYAGGFASGECTTGSHLWYWTPPSTGTYRVLITKLGCLTWNQCAVMAYHTELNPYSGPGLNCGNPWIIPSIPYSQSGLTSCYYGNEYTSANACGSQYMNGEDFVMRFAGTAGQCISIYTANTFIYTGLFLLNGCPNAGGTTCLAYHEAAAGNPQIFNVTLPATGNYYIVMDMNPSQAPGCTPFDITVVPCVAVGQGSTCANAYVIPSLPYNQIGFTTCGRGNTYNSTMACGSPYMNGEDFVFKYVSPGNECISIDVSNTQPYTAFFVLNGCPNVGGTSCIASKTASGGNPKLRNINLTAAGTYYILVSTWPAPQCTQFNMKVTHCPPACSHNPNMSDFCTSPTPVSFGFNDTVCGFTNYLYTADASSNLLSNFCGSIENNGWFSFVADSTKVTIKIDVSNCNSGYGIQGRIFETTNCISFTPRSNCWNPMAQSNGIIQATGLTIGNTYYLMFDGYATDDCQFNAYRLHGPLPVEWNEFSATLLGGKRVQVDWSTVAEVNALGFYVQRGYKKGNKQADDFVWESIAFVPSHGGPSQGATYQQFDTPTYTGDAWYYRIQQVDLDGNSIFTDYQKINLAGPAMAEIRSFYPNPASRTVTLEYYAPRAGASTAALYSSSGVLVKQVSLNSSQQGLYKQEISLEDVSNGLYLYVISINGMLFKGKLDVFH